jgi:hypothetical protein
MRTSAEEPPRTIGRAEGWSLHLVFGGPVSLWVPMARLVGVKVDRAAVIDDEMLVDAEAGAWLAGRRFAAGLIATTVCTLALLAWLPVQARSIGPLVHSGFDGITEGILGGGGPFWLAITVASATTTAFGVIAGLLNAAVFGGIPLALLRRCTVAAAPAVSVAMTQGDSAFATEQAVNYPRVAFAAERILYPRGRARG